MLREKKRIFGQPDLPHFSTFFCFSSSCLFYQSQKHFQGKLANKVYTIKKQTLNTASINLPGETIASAGSFPFLFLISLLPFSTTCSLKSKHTQFKIYMRCDRLVSSMDKFLACHYLGHFFVKELLRVIVHCLISPETAVITSGRHSAKGRKKNLERKCGRSIRDTLKD